MNLAQRLSPETDDLVGRARELFPLLRRNSDKNDENRFICDESIKAITDAGLWGMLVPERWGGHGASASTAVRVIAEISKACPSTGWIFEIMATGAWMPSLQVDAVQETAYANGIPLICGSTSIDPQAKSFTVARRAPGGFIVNGRWKYASGCLHADWGVFLLPLAEEDGTSSRYITCMTPIANVQIKDGWFVAGMRGTASRDVLLEDVFVPEHMNLQHLDALSAGAEHAANKYFGAPSDFIPFQAMYATSTAAVLLGIADGVLEMVREGTRKRGIFNTRYKLQVDSQVAVRDIGEAAMQIEAARLLLKENADELDGYALRGEHAPPAARARIRGRAAYVPKLLREAVEALMSINGASGFSTSNALQRHWRDLGMASRHTVVNSNPGLELVGEELLGIDPKIMEEY